MSYVVVGWLTVCVALLGCSGDSASPHEEVEHLWGLKMGDVKLTKTVDRAIGTGDCKTGTVRGLHVDLCLFKDTLSADSARDLGLVRIGSDTGASLVRDRLLLVVSDPSNVDPHGKTLNQLAKLFMEPNGPN